jgi:hypothetical protein
VSLCFEFVIVQGGVQLDARPRSNTQGVFCGNVFAPFVLALSEALGEPAFDATAAFTLIFNNREISQVDVAEIKAGVRFPDGQILGLVNAAQTLPSGVDLTLGLTLSRRPSDALFTVVPPFFHAGSGAPAPGMHRRSQRTARAGDGCASPCTSRSTRCVITATNCDEIFATRACVSGRTFESLTSREYS